MAAGAIVETACLVCDNGELEVGTAKCFKLTESNIDSYYNDVETKWANHSLPPVNKAVEWTVYKFSSSRMFKHHSLFFVCESSDYKTTHGFTIELRVLVDGTRAMVNPYTCFYPSSVSTYLSTLGTVTDSAKEIMEQGLQCLADFGDYKKYSNNCQDYCSKLAKELDMKQPWTDAEKTVALGMAGVGVIAAVGIGLAALWSRSGNNSKKE